MHINNRKEVITIIQQSNSDQLSDSQKAFLNQLNERRQREEFDAEAKKEASGKKAATGYVVDGAGESTIKDDIKSSKPRSGDTLLHKRASGAGNKIANFEAGVAKMVTSQAYRTITAGTDTGKGIQAGAIAATAGAFVFTNVTHGSIRSSLKSDFVSTYKELQKDIKLPNIEIGSARELANAKKALAEHFKSRGLGTVRDSTPAQMLETNVKLGMGQSKVMTDADKLALKAYKKLGVLENNQKSAMSVRSLTGLVSLTLRQQARDSETFQGISFASNIHRRANQTMRVSIRAVMRSRFFMANASRFAFRTSALLAAKMAKSELAIFKAARAQAAAAEQTRAAQALKAKAQAVKRARERINQSKFSSGAKNVRDKYKRINAARKNATKRLSPRYWTNRLRGRIAQTRFGKAISKLISPLTKISRMLGFGNAAVKAVISTIFKYIGIALFGVILIVAVIGGVIVIISSLVSAFNATMDEAALKDSIAIIREEYETDVARIESISKNYNSVRVSYEDIIDEDAYEAPSNIPESKFIQSTNAAEIISMAMVQFDFDLGGAEDHELDKYLRGIYNGSHIITTTTTESHADIKLTTYYFNELFDRPLMDDTISLAAGEIEQGVWDYLTNQGLTEIQAAGIMGNIYRESGFDPAAIESGNGIGIGLCQWSFGRRTELENYAASQGKPVSDLQVQLEFLMSEITPSHFNSYYTGVDNYEYFMNASTTDDAVYYFCWGWERPAKWAGEESMAKGQQAASSYYAMFSKQ